MAFKTSHWEPGNPFPKYADRKTLAKIISFECFPVSHRTIQTWPLTVRRPNRATVYDVGEALEYAQSKLDKSVCYKQGVYHE